MVLVASGSELRLNRFTAGDQERVAIARDPAGNFVAVWQSQDQDGSGQGIFAQRFDAVGNPLGGEFQVNSFTARNQSDPTIAIDGAGNFTIAWVDVGRPYVTSGVEVRDESGLYLRRFNSSGEAIGTEVLVDRDVTVFPSGSVPGFFRTELLEPAIAMNRSGNFVLTWRFANDIYARRFNADGTPAGAFFRVNTVTAESQFDPDIAINAAGDFVISWTSSRQEADRASFGIFARRFDSAGVPQESEFQVNTAFTNAQINSAVAMDDAGNTTIVWEHFNRGIIGQRYSTMGTAIGGEFLVSRTGRGFATNPDIAIDPDGDTVVTWESFSDAIYAQSYTAQGFQRGGNVRVSNAPATDQFQPAIATDSLGNVVISWVDTRRDGSGRGTFAQNLLLSPNEELTGTAANDVIDGGSGNDTILGLAGNDRLLGGVGRDRLLGGNGNDNLLGGDGNDTLLGEAGNDRLNGDAGNDFLNGGTGVDVLFGGLGNDLLDGGAGNDRLVGGAGRDRFTLRRREGRDLIQDFQDGVDRLVLGGGLRFRDLTITQAGRNTVIRAGTESLAILTGIAATQITIADTAL